MDSAVLEPTDIGMPQARGSGVVSPGPPLSVKGLRKRFAENEVLKGVDLELEPGRIVAVLGANGCGKSTLLRCAIGLLTADDGDVRLCGRNLSELRGRGLREARRQAAVVFQQIALVRGRSALDNVCSGALGELPLHRSLHPALFPSHIRERAALALQRVGMLDKAWQLAGTLSGGQAQRVAIARAYCQRASVILADEPVSALDPRAAQEVLELLADVAHNDQLAVLVVLHQPDLALRYADRVLGMRLGEIVFDEPPSAIEPAQIEGLYHHLEEVAT
jgi:phosphonate transport system ATP-binding protein